MPALTYSRMVKLLRILKKARLSMLIVASTGCLDAFWLWQYKTRLTYYSSKHSKVLLPAINHATHFVCIEKSPCFIVSSVGVIRLA